MPELLEKIQIHLDNPDSEDCPFCPAKETEHKWKTFKGEKNSSGTLREAMNDPKRCGYAHQSGAKPKDGKYPNQNQDAPQPNPDPIYSHPQYGRYGDQAHHCISGNEIMKNHPIEKILANENGDYKGETGYTINTAANGVYLPSYPENYSGNENQKYEIVKHAMAAGKGQIHIGGHTGHEHAVGQPGHDHRDDRKKECPAIDQPPRRQGEPEQEQQERKQRRRGGGDQLRLGSRPRCTRTACSDSQTAPVRPCVHSTQGPNALVGRGIAVARLVGRPLVGRADPLLHPPDLRKRARLVRTGHGSTLEN